MQAAYERATPRAARLLASVMVVALAAPVVAEESERVVEEIVVIGSRIEKPDYAFSNPVLSVDAEAIEYSGTTDLVGYLKEIPALAGSLDANDAAGPNAFIGGTGLSLLDLRNLGEDRTLVLVDGRRHVASLPGSSAVDVDTIPIDLIERVEVMTGGASAIYGADGVTGVVNFKMKDDFEGLSVRAQGGQSAEEDADTALFSIAAGRNFMDGRSNVTVAFEYSRNDRLEGVDRDYATGNARRTFVLNPDDPGTYDSDLDDPALPDNVPLGDIRYFDTWRGGAVDTGFDGVPDFIGEDSPWDPGLEIPPYFQQGGSGTRIDEYIGDLLPREERATFNVFAHIDATDHVRAFGEVKYSRNESLSRSQPTFDYLLWIEPDNPYIPPNIGAALVDSEAPAVLVSRDNFDLGVRGEDITRETWRTVAGLEGDLGDRFRWEASYVYGRTDVDNDVLNNRINDRFAAAIDAVVGPGGQVVCRSDLDPAAEPANIFWQIDVLEGGGWNRWTPAPPSTWAGTFTPGAGSGCVPVDLFGDGSVSAAAKDWITATTSEQSDIEQHVVQAYVTGDLGQWFELPAGPVGVAFGGEYRKEESSSQPSPLDRGGFTYGNIIDPTNGDYDVYEAFAEIDVPLLRDAPFARELSMDAAYRVSDYSTIGNADTWKVGLVWQPLLDVTFRGTVAEATRSPNISELYSLGQTFQFIDDPCDQNRVGNGTEFRADNCAQVLTALGVDPGEFSDPNSASISGVLRGNEDLSEEVAETWTVGFILQPRFAEELTLSVDYYDIELTDAINTADPQTAAELCVDLPTIDNNYCTLFEREVGTGAITGFTQQPFNVAEFTTRGYDFTVAYTLEAARIGLGDGMGLFDFRLVGNKLTDLTYVELPGADPNPDAGEEDAPKWQYTFDLTWQREPFLVNYGITYFSETQRYTKQERASNPDITANQWEDYDEHFVQDLHGEYALQDGLSFYAGVNNLADEQPDVGRTFYPVSAVGRFFYLGMTFEWQ